MAVIAEAYFHFRMGRIGEAKLAAFGDELTEISILSALENHFPPEAVIDIHLREGSIKGWIKVGGYALLTLQAISSYSGLKQSVSEMIDDSTRFSQFVTEQAVRHFNVPRSSILKLEKRTGTPGRLLRVLDRYEKLEAQRTSLPKQWIEREEREIARLLNQLKAELSDEDITVLESVLGKRIPPPPEYDPRVAIREPKYEQQDLFDLPKPKIEPLDYTKRIILKDFMK